MGMTTSDVPTTDPDAGCLCHECSLDPMNPENRDHTDPAPPWPVPAAEPARLAGGEITEGT